MRTLNPDLLFFIQWLRLIPHLTTPIRKQFSQNNKLNQKNKTKAAVRLGNNKVSEFSRRLERFNKRIKSPAFKLGNKLSLTHVLWHLKSRKHIVLLGSLSPAIHLSRRRSSPANCLYRRRSSPALSRRRSWHRLPASPSSPEH